MSVNDQTRCLCNWKWDGGSTRRVFSSECPVHNPKPPQGGTVLAVQARALAAHVAAFNDLVARDTNTHDGNERGKNWREGAPDLNGDQISRFAVRLNDLADLWDFG